MKYLLLVALLIVVGCNTPVDKKISETQKGATQSEVAASDPVQVLFTSAIHKFRRDQVESGLADLKMAAKMKPDNPEMAEAFLVVALKMNSVGKTEAALGVVELAIEIDSGKAHFWQNKARFLFSLEKPEQARAAFAKAREIAPDDPGIPYEMGWQASHSTATYEQAISDYDAAIELDASFQKAWTNRGVLRKELGQHEQALKDLDKALELKPDDSVALYTKAEALVAMGRKAEGHEVAKRVIELNQHEATVKMAEAMLSAEEPKP